MRLFASGGLFLLLISFVLSLASGQRNAPELKHLPVAPVNGLRWIQAEALNIERGVEYPSLVRLQGSVLIKTPVCVPLQQGGHICDGEMIVRADEADLDEKTGEIRPRGNVVVTPLRHLSTK